MLAFLKKLLGNSEQPAISQPSAKSPQTAKTYAGERPAIDSFKTGFRDSRVGGWFSASTDEVYENFKVTAEDIVLDVGCGDGGAINFCAKRGADILFSDIDPHKVAQKERSLQGTAAKSIKAIISDANPLPLGDASATKIISMEVIEHVDDPVQFLNELARVGKPGAQYLISAPHAISEYLQKDFAAPQHFEKPNHIRILDTEEFKRLVTNAGLTIEHHSLEGFYWSIWWMIFWSCEQDLSPPWHPALQHWAETWSALLDTPAGPQVKEALDQIIPKTQIIIARKPA